MSFANVWRRNADVEGVLAELAAGEHDVVALAEVTEKHLDAIEAAFPASTYPWRNAILTHVSARVLGFGSWQCSG